MSSRRIDRRSFIKHSAAAVGTASIASAATREERRAPEILVRRPHPVVVASANGHPRCTETAMGLIQEGKKVVDAVVAGVNIVENDPRDHSVGLGGLPNERGVVELDSSVMDGPTALAGAVAALQRIRNPSRVALRVMRNTDHCLLVGPGALEFARAHGFEEQELLTDAARKIWLKWKTTLSEKDDWLPGDQSRVSPAERKLFETTGTINCNGVNGDGELAGVTTTSGLAFKIPGRVGDSPIIGAGLYVDNAVGAAGSTGRGEANIISCGSFVVVEGMRQGMHPKDACLHACRRIASLTRAAHLTRKDGRPNFNVKFYAVDKKGRHGGAAIWPGGTYAVFDAEGNRTEKLAALFE